MYFRNMCHIKKAGSENLDMLHSKDVKVRIIDADDLHINEHIGFMLSEDFDKQLEKDSKLEEIFLNHISQHQKSIDEKRKKEVK